MRAVGDQKQCSACRVTKHVDEFWRYKGSPDGRHNQCRACAREVARRSFKKTYAERREGYLAANRDYLIQRKYGLTPDQYEALLVSQGGVCAICKQECSSGKRLAVDHDHSCCPGKESCGRCIRGLLCSRCNQGLGCFQDSLDLFKSAVEYLGLSVQTL